MPDREEESIPLLWVKTRIQCDSTVKVRAYIEDPGVIKKILEHLDHHTESVKRTPHPARVLAAM